VRIWQFHSNRVSNTNEAVHFLVGFLLVVREYFPASTRIGKARDPAVNRARAANILSQNRNFRPNWIWRMGEARLVICPGPWLTT